MTNWYDSIVDGVKQALDSAYASKSDVDDLKEAIVDIINGTGGA